MHESIVFCSTYTMSSYRKFTFAISSSDEFFVYIYTAGEKRFLDLRVKMRIGSTSGSK